MAQQSQLLGRSDSKGKAPIIVPSTSPHLGKRPMGMAALTDATGKQIILSAGASTSSAAPASPEKRPRIDAPADAQEQGNEPVGGDANANDPVGGDPDGDVPPNGDEPEEEDLINKLPNDLLTSIFSYIPEVKNRCRCSCVSKKWFVMQAAMRKSDFKAVAVAQPKPHVSRRNLNCHINGARANSVVLACMAISMEAWGTLCELSVQGNGPAPPERRIHDRSLSILMRAGSSLRSISLTNCPLIGGLGIRSIARYCLVLQKLHLCNMASVTDDCLEDFAKTRTTMVNVQLVSMPKVTNRTLQAFAQHMENLTVFHVEACPLVTDDGVVSMITGQPKLEVLTVTYMKLGDHVFESLAHYGEHIRWLKFVGISGVSATGYRWLGAVKNLQNIMLEACPDVTDISFAKTLPEATFGNLRHVVIGNCNTLSDAGLVDIAGSSKHLEGLVLRDCSGFTSRGLMEALGKCRRTLRMLALTRCTFIRAPWHNVFPMCLSLTVIYIDDCRGLGDGFLLWIGDCCKRLRSLSIINMKDEITDNGIRYFMLGMGPYNDIYRINLSGCTAVGNRSVWAVTKNCSRLRLLLLSDCTRVSDAGVGVITKRCKMLAELDVSRCNIGDQGVRRLAKHLPWSLELLTFAGCPRITDQSVVDLKRNWWMRLNIAGCIGISAEFRQSLRQIFRSVVY